MNHLFGALCFIYKEKQWVIVSMQYPLRKFLLKPGLPILQLHRKDTAAVFWIFGLMVFEEHLFVIQHAEDFNFAGFVRHCIAHTLAEAIALRLGLIHDFCAFRKRHLKLRFHMSDRPALEDVVGDDTVADQGIEEVCQCVRIVVYAAE